MLAADFSGKGYLDLATADYGDDMSLITVSLLLNNPVEYNPSVSYHATWDTMGISPASAADFDGDGDIDVAVVAGPYMDGGTLYGGYLIILSNLGDGTFQQYAFTGVSDNQPTTVVAADFNGDCHVDLATTRASSGDTDTYVDVLINRGDGTFYPPVSNMFTSEVGMLEGLVAADFSGDGFVDLAVATDGFAVATLINNGDGSFGQYTLYPVAGAPGSMVAADFNQDGHIDLATVSPTSADRQYFDNRVSLLFNTGNGSFAPFKTTLTGRKPTSVSAADFDGDGRIDLVTADVDYQNDDGTVSGSCASILLNTGGGSFAAPVKYYVTSEPIYVTAADLNNDGSIDVALANFGNSTVTVLANVGDGTFVYTPSAALADPLPVLPPLVR